MGLKLAGIMFILMMAMGGMGYWYYTDTQSKIAILHENNAKLEVATKLQKETIAQTKKDLVLSTAVANDAMEKFQTARKATEDLNARFNKVSSLLGQRDIGKLAQARPKPIQRIVNKGSKNIMRCFEVLSGQALTEKEKNADRKSQINSMCPTVVNPSYTPSQ
jgi:hypothetical protein